MSKIYTVLQTGATEARRFKTAAFCHWVDVWKIDLAPIDGNSDSAQKSDFNLVNYTNFLQKSLWKSSFQEIKVAFSIKKQDSSIHIC